MVGTPSHVLGTDEQGRDMLTRLLHGGRTSLVAGPTPVLVALLVGSTLGVTAGFAGGRLNLLIRRVVDFFFAFPFHPARHRHLRSPGSRVEGHGHRARDRLYPAGRPRRRKRCHHPASYDRSRAGADFRVRQHAISVSVIIASGLSFLGLGVSPRNAEWGLMLNTLRGSIYVHPLVAALPGVMIFMTSMSFNL
jgi:peptide/nickel transport system permease protein